MPARAHLDPLPAFRAPRSILDLVNYQLHQIESRSAGLVTRICEGEFGITRREWRFLALLAVLGEQSPSQLATLAALDRPRTSKALASLQQRGLVERRGVAGDGRRQRIRLSAAGHALHERLFPRVVQVNLALLDDFSEREVMQLARLLKRLHLASQSLPETALVSARVDRRGGGTRHRWAATT